MVLVGARRAREAGALAGLGLIGSLQADGTVSGKHHALVGANRAGEALGLFLVVLERPDAAGLADGLACLVLEGAYEAREAGCLSGKGLVGVGWARIALGGPGVVLVGARLAISAGGLAWLVLIRGGPAEPAGWRTKRILV